LTAVTAHSSSRSPSRSLALTAEQRAVVDAPDDAHLTVLAVAGSGKTTTMVHRLAELARRGVAPATMRAVMFNKAAQRAFESRLAALLAEAGADPRALRVQTWHALAFGIVRHLEETGAVERMPLATEEGRLLRAVAECVREEFAERAERPAEDDGRDPERCLAAIREWKSMLVAPARAGHASDDFLVSVYARFERLRARERFRTFDDLVRDAVEALEADPGRRGLADRFEHLVVDEFQDCDHGQFRLLELLAGTRARVTVVGDDDQTIHEWRGARSAFIRGGFAARFTAHPHRAFALTTTFRFGPLLAAAAERAIAPAEGRVAKPIVAADSAQESRLVAITASEAPSSAKADARAHAAPGALDPLVERLETLLARGTPADDIVVLGRSWAQLLAFEWRLLAARVPFAMDEHAAFARDPSLGLLLAYLTAARTFRHPLDEALAANAARLLNRPFRGLSRKGIDMILKDGVREGLSLSDIATDDDLQRLAGFHGGARGELKALGATLLKAMRRGQSEGGAASAIRLVRAEVDLREALAAHRSPASVAECLRAYEVLEDFARADGCALDQLEARLAAVDTTQGHAAADCVRVTTIHRVKGLEWDFVFIPECDEGWMPLAGDEESPCFDTKDPSRTLDRSPAIESERRLFYVAITRARTACFVGAGDEAARSRFLRDAIGGGANAGAR
jgi:DNA helicase-2/ATP-dependent DNA helicase PcrA